METQKADLNDGSKAPRRGSDDRSHLGPGSRIKRRVGIFLVPVELPALVKGRVQASTSSSRTQARLKANSARSINHQRARPTARSSWRKVHTRQQVTGEITYEKA